MAKKDSGGQWWALDKGELNLDSDAFLQQYPIIKVQLSNLIIVRRTRQEAGATSLGNTDNVQIVFGQSYLVTLDCYTQQYHYDHSTTPALLSLLLSLLAMLISLALALTGALKVIMVY